MGTLHVLNMAEVSVGIISSKNREGVGKEFMPFLYALLTV
jgi:hypothetical protein